MAFAAQTFSRAAFHRSQSGSTVPSSDDIWFWPARIDGDPTARSYLALVAVWTKLTVPLTGSRPSSPSAIRTTIAYLTIRLFLTDMTPLTLLVISPAFLAAS